ncbi:MAG: hypothetical protein WBO55_03775 [Rhizobiaceae bacterium]
MDAYNRGYCAGIGDGENVVHDVDQDGLRILNASIGQAQLILDDASEVAQAAGFYAIHQDATFGAVRVLFGVFQCAGKRAGGMNPAITVNR